MINRKNKYHHGSIRKKDDKKDICFYCCKKLLKGSLMIIHDNIQNKVNPKTFCSKKHKELWILESKGYKEVSILNFLE